MYNKENIQKWVDALRSGKFKQGRLALCSVRSGEETYCCLGVACEITPGVSKVLQHYRNCYAYESHESSLPQLVRDWLGIQDGNPVVIIHKTTNESLNLISLNDDREVTFEEIADAIEYTFLGEHENAKNRRCT